MKTSIVATLAGLLLISNALFAQEKVNSVRPDNAPAASAKPLMVAGQVSNDRKTLVTDIDSEWLVSNPDALKGHEGHHVQVSAHVYADKNQIHVMSVKMPPASKMQDDSMKKDNMSK